MRRVLLLLAAMLVPAMTVLPTAGSDTEHPGGLVGRWQQLRGTARPYWEHPLFRDYRPPPDPPADPPADPPPGRRRSRFATPT